MKTKRAKHSLSNYKLLTCNQGNLVPIGVYETIRGDIIQQHSTAMIRVAPLAKPTMHPVHTKIHHWNVPMRLIWSDWENFITGGPDGNNAAIPPTITFASGIAVGSLGDYLGLPTGSSSITVSALPFRAYALIWNTFYRDQDLETALTISLASGADVTTNTTLQNCAWMKDYFTTARPEPQKGDEVIMPLGGDAPVLGIGKGNTTFGAAANNVYESDGTQSNYTNAQYFDGTADQVFYVEKQSVGGVNYPNIRADLSQAEGPSVNEVRLAMALQRMKEARSKYGSKYVDFLDYYGIKSSDARLQRPEYLGGGRETIRFSEVVSTATTTEGTSGDLYGHGLGVTKSNRYQKFFEEDGITISLMCTQPITMYTQGIPKMWSRATKEDYFQKELQHIGQMPILNKEVKYDHADAEGVFGWQDKYDDYRRIENTIAGEFRTTEADWHMGRIFATDPALNAAFVSANPTDRIYTSTATDQLFCYVKHTIRARRFVAKYGKSFIY